MVLSRIPRRVADRPSDRETEAGATQGAGSARRLPIRFRAQSINRLIPNIVTLMALCSGLTGIRFAMEGRFQAAVVAVLAAAVLDGLDGRIARLMKATSRFGAELDSLSDFVCFGVVPAVLLYLWTMHDAGRIGWAAVLIFAVCGALRLARFNTALDSPEQPGWTYNFFTGVPAPAAAGLSILPMIVTFEMPGVVDGPLFVGAWTVGIAALMVSRVPTFAVKRLRIPNVLVLPTLLIVGIVAAGIATEPWLTLVGLGLAYLASIPLSLRAAWRLRRTLERAHAAVEKTP
jgi:CDP-diacylglycerol---serine O-phosphatidyltransferase